MQIKMKKTGFSNTVSGNLNAKHKEVSNKLLDLNDFDVEMLSPNFLASKTLKKPLPNFELSLSKTNPNGAKLYSPMSDEFNRSSSMISDAHLKTSFRNQMQPQKDEDFNNEYKYISATNLNIKPAIRHNNNNFIPTAAVQPTQLLFKDKNSIISALMRKGDLNPAVPFEININKVQQVQGKVGPAQAKLRNMMKKKQNNNTLTVEPAGKKKSKQVVSQLQIDEDIHESIEEYVNQQFQQISGAYESQIKQSIRESIRESIGGASSAIKESIRQSIRDQIPESMKSMSKSKSKQEVKEEIMMDSRNRESIEEEVYEEIFQEMSVSDDLSKSKNKNFKKKQEDRLELSASGSKNFRTKSKVIQKSIKFADELNILNQNSAKTSERIQQKYEKGDKLAEEIIKEKACFEKLQQKISAILNAPGKQAKPQSNKNLQLYYKFKIEINRLMTSENFMSKLRKLTAFIGASPASKGANDVSSLEDKLLSNLMERIHDLRVSGVTQEELARVKKQYDEKMSYLLKEQQMSLRVEMDRKLHEKDLELKKMIAELEQKVKNSTFVGTDFDKDTPRRKNYGDRVEVDSDYSIESDQISWKMDLWEVLPDYEKKKLYEKQSAEVANFLTDVLMNEIKNENLDRSGDISFEFPEQFNEFQSSTHSASASASESKQLPSFNKKSASETYDDMKPAFNREELRKQVGKTQKSEMFPPLPGVKKGIQTNQEHPEYNIHFMQMGKIHDNEVLRDTLSVSEVVKILSKYKGAFLKKKNDLVRKLVKTLQQKPQESDPMISLINDIRIMNPKEINEADQPFVKAYEEDIIMELMTIYNKNKYRKSNFIEEEMKKMYERLVVTCQVKAAESSVRNANEIIPNETYVDYRMAQEDKKIKDVLVTQICNILAIEFAKQMPKRKK